MNINAFELYSSSTLHINKKIFYSSTCSRVIEVRSTDSIYDQTVQYAVYVKVQHKSGTLELWELKRRSGYAGEKKARFSQPQMSHFEIIK